MRLMVITLQKVKPPLSKKMKYTYIREPQVSLSLRFLISVHSIYHAFGCCCFAKTHICRTAYYILEKSVIRYCIFLSY